MAVELATYANLAASKIHPPCYLHRCSLWMAVRSGQGEMDYGDGRKYQGAIYRYIQTKRQWFYERVD
jgi:hypothetical protein